MAWLYVPDLEDLSEGLNPLLMATEPFAMSKGKPIPRRSWPLRWKKDKFLKHLCGLMCEPSKANDGVEKWILSLGGFPCQPYSQAGKQLADKDPRDLWPDFSRIIGEVRPRIIFLENVPNVVKWALPTVLKDLSQMGYDAAWCVVAASDVGAPHQRKRWFLLAHSNSGTPSQPQRTARELRQKGSRLERRENQREAWDISRGSGEKGGDVPHANNSSEYAMREHEPFKGSSKLEKALCDSNRDGFGQYANENSREGVFEEWSMEGNRLENIGLDDTHSERVRRDENQYSASRRKFNVEGVRGEVPDTSSLRGKQNYRLRKPNDPHKNGPSRFFGGWWQVEPSVGRMVDGVAHWVHRIRGCGNGVVPQQAEYAFRLLNEQLGAVE